MYEELLDEYFKVEVELDAVQREEEIGGQRQTWCVKDGRQERDLNQ